MDDELVLCLGVDIYGVVIDVFINVDGFKKFIFVFGLGNYLMVVKVVVSVVQIVGLDIVCYVSFVYVYGFSMLVNWVIELEIFDCVVSVFGIDGWLVIVVKVYVGYFLVIVSVD